MTHPVGLVTYHGFVHAWVLDLPGCIAGGRDTRELHTMLPLAIAEHASWLRSHDAVDVGAADPADYGAAAAGWEIAERVDGGALEATGGEFCFEADRAPLDHTELASLIDRIEFARDELLTAVRALPDAVLDWVPPDSAVQSFDPWAPEPRTVREVVRHTLQLEVYYRDGLRDGPAAGIFESVAEPASERSRTLELLRSMDDEALSRVYHPVRPSRQAHEPWTVRKVVRRLVSHDRTHAAEVQQRRTWVLLGAPRLAPLSDAASRAGE
jgi:hypothetical protein